MSIRSKNVYAFNLLKASKVSFDQDYSYLLSRMLNIESLLTLNKISISNFAPKLAKTFSDSKASFDIDRVCLCLSYPGSHQIKVLSTVNGERLSKNMMETGYQCYVSRRSSLFSLKPNEVRTYDNISDIISQYRSEGKPIQRSLARLERMGVKSGLTIPLPLNDLTSGFLYLNSAVPGSFAKFTDADYLIVAALKLVGVNTITRHLQKTSTVDQRLSNILNRIHGVPNTFSSDVFSNVFGSAIQEKTGEKVSVIVDSQFETPSFFPIKTAVYSLIRFLESVNLVFGVSDYRFTARKEGDDLVLRLKTEVNRTLAETIFKFDESFLTSNIQVSLEQGGIALKSPFEASSFLESDIDYSVEVPTV